ncbi:hypothetical protein PHYPSEUDO_005419 [Phytophthora pseudosyringae]|uniref:Uncharacterized protein n=1 Tax=Phytophthora pseudosyringae TaxID=221518 RepID=A0A8T1VP05_9STRA|nr:hypothetical protein PHYPSEUDO_005419 [Phytophthora pseudosyringae]
MFVEDVFTLVGENVPDRDLQRLRTHLEAVWERDAVALWWPSLRLALGERLKPTSDAGRRMPDVGLPLTPSDIISGSQTKRRARMEACALDSRITDDQGGLSRSYTPQYKSHATFLIGVKRTPQIDPRRHAVATPCCPRPGGPPGLLPFRATEVVPGGGKGLHSP